MRCIITISAILLTAATLSGCLMVPKEGEEAQALSLAEIRSWRGEAQAPDASVGKVARSEPSGEADSPVDHQDIDAATDGSEAREDLWDRIRDGFTLTTPDPGHLSSAIRWSGLRQAYLDQVTERARPYLHHIVEEVERREMPTEIALLPIVESAYRPEAYSPRQAAGIWQLMPRTGRRFGLKQTVWYDGRRDVLASTGAALDYLEVLRDRFGGDWLHALAAYNCGEGAMARAIRRNERAGRPTDFWALELPAETERFVPKLLAISNIVAKPATYNVSLNRIPNAPYLIEVDVGRQIDLDRAARLARMVPEEMRRLNPGLKRAMTDPAGPHKLVLPVEKAEVFKARVAQLDGTAVPTKASGPTRLKPARSSRQPRGRVSRLREGVAFVHRRVHRVSGGETLAGIARTYNIPLGRLIAANQLPKRTVLKRGQRLLIPVGGSKALTVADSA